MPRKKRPKTDDPVARTKAEMYGQAKAGLFRKFPEFEAMCLSREGYEPIHAQHCLSPYMPDATAASLIAAAREAAKVWRHPLAPAKADTPEGEGGPAFILMEPFAAGGDYTRKWEDHFLAQGWIMPAGYKRAVPETPVREGPSFRDLLKKKKPDDDGNDGGGGDAA